MAFTRLGATIGPVVAAARPVGHATRIIAASAAIVAHAPSSCQFQHSVFAQLALPARRPGPTVHSWSARNGAVFCNIDAGSAVDPRTGRHMPLALPWGIKARLLLIELNTQAVRQRSPIVDVGTTLTAFTRGLLQRRPKGRETRAIKAQLLSLAAAHVTLGFISSGCATHEKSEIVEGFKLWAVDATESRGWWPRVVKLSSGYFADLVEHAVPLDPRAIAALSHSALALDVYQWLSQRLHRVPIGRHQLVPWVSLHGQFGGRPTRLDLFRREFRGALRAVQRVYPTARVLDFVDARGWPHGLKLFCSPPPVPVRPFTRSRRAHFSGAAAPISSDNPIGPDNRPDSARDTRARSASPRSSGKSR